MNESPAGLLTPEEIASHLGLHQPTPQQSKVISAPLEPLLVVAGAGSGKTETMAARVVYLVANGLVKPEEVLGLTFTRKAAGELSERVQKRLGQLAEVRGMSLNEGEHPNISTYNSFAAQIVTEYGLWLGIESGANLLADTNAWQLMSDVVQNYTGTLETGLALATVTEDVLRLNDELSGHLVSSEAFEHFALPLLARIHELPLGKGRSVVPKMVQSLRDSLQLRVQYLGLAAEFNERKRQREALTYGDQIALAAQLATAVPAISEANRSRYRVVLLDEYQDTSHAQVRLLAGLFGNGHPVTAVGDPNQAIYGWRGASASGLVKFPAEFRDAKGNPASVLPLMTAWRNDSAVLEAANLVADPLRQSESSIKVPKLELSPTAGQGQVIAKVTETSADEANEIADWIAANWNPEDPRLAATAAVLCRKRSQFTAIAEALEARSIPVEIVGLGGLLETPVVSDLVAFLRVAADPGRGDALLRLLTGPRLNLGISDIYALSSWARDLARHNVPEVIPELVVADDADNHSLIDALDQLPPLNRAARDGRVISPAGHRRLTQLAASVHRLRRLSHLSLSEVCSVAERELGLDIEVNVAQALELTKRGRLDLDAFRDVAANFSKTADSPTLLGFLTWLEAALERENGLDMPVVDIDSAAVQLITVHAAKGLEWDIVAVPGLVDGTFPGNAETGKGRADNAWLTGRGSLPFPVRGDVADLPTLNWHAANDMIELEAEIEKFRLAAGQHGLNSERRLAYVGFTRARNQVLLTGYRWSDAVKPKVLSPFLLELAEAGLVDDGDWFPEPEEGAENPLTAIAQMAIWPRTESAQEQRIREGAEMVRAARAEITAENADQHLTPLARLLLAERDQPRENEVVFPDRVSTTALVRLAEDREAFAVQLRRPIPVRPFVQSLVGTQFHDWIQDFYEPQAGQFDLDDGWPTDDDESATNEAELERLKQVFLNGPWAGLRPIAVEQEIHQQLGRVAVVARIDAVFEDPDRPGAHLVVDWKTGRPPRTESERHSREVQLAIYRLGWSKLTGKPLERISAAFHYVGTGETVRADGLMTEAELMALIAGDPD
ncbi:MAG: ATP-dependent helicase [Promicromonosporaceae bacterium]|nr:ATP-dependent helicase [Promicromonosporaceae bacterium]